MSKSYRSVRIRQVSFLRSEREEALSIESVEIIDDDSLLQAEKTQIKTAFEKLLLKNDNLVPEHCDTPLSPFDIVSNSSNTHLENTEEFVEVLESEEDSSLTESQSVIPTHNAEFIEVIEDEPECSEQTDLSNLIQDDDSKIAEQVPESKKNRLLVIASSQKLSIKAAIETTLSLQATLKPVLEEIFQNENDVEETDEQDFQETYSELSSDEELFHSIEKMGESTTTTTSALAYNVMLESKEIRIEVSESDDEGQELFEYESEDINIDTRVNAIAIDGIVTFYEEQSMPTENNSTQEESFIPVLHTHHEDSIKAEKIDPVDDTIEDESAVFSNDALDGTKTKSLVDEHASDSIFQERLPLDLDDNVSHLQKEQIFPNMEHPEDQMDSSSSSLDRKQFSTEFPLNNEIVTFENAIIDEQVLIDTSQENVDANIDAVEWQEIVLNQAEVSNKGTGSTHVKESSVYSETESEIVIKEEISVDKQVEKKIQEIDDSLIKTNMTMSTSVQVTIENLPHNIDKEVIKSQSIGNTETSEQNLDTNSNDLSKDESDLELGQGNKHSIDVPVQGFPSTVLGLEQTSEIQFDRAANMAVIKEIVDTISTNIESKNGEGKIQLSVSFGDEQVQLTINTFETAPNEYNISLTGLSGTLESTIFNSKEQIIGLLNQRGIIVHQVFISEVLEDGSEQITQPLVKSVSSALEKEEN